MIFSELRKLLRYPLPVNCIVNAGCGNQERNQELMLDKVNREFYQLRNLRSEQYFNESYLTIFLNKKSV